MIREENAGRMLSPEMIERLLEWFAVSARVLPWREDPSPYHVWVSEIMLQQTRVEAVKPYYERFLTALPSVQELAACEEDRLLKLWEGLGYYSRVRNMQRAAQIITERYEGKIPSDYEVLKTLPGIGSYTAGAIASIAFSLPVPAVDGNVLRVMARLQEDSADILKASTKSRVEKELLPLMPGKRSGLLNQAFMDLGAGVCLPNTQPLCAGCPLSSSCAACAHGTQMQYPVRAVRTKRRVEDRTILVVRDETGVLLRRRPQKGLLAGLYELPGLEGHLSENEVLQYLKDEGFAPIRIIPLCEARHIFSHVEWHMTGYLVLTENMEDAGEKGGYLVVEPWRTQKEYPVPAAFRAYAKYLNIQIGRDGFKNTDQLRLVSE